MTKFPALVLLATLSIPALAADYRVLPDSKVGFTGTFQGASFDGEFRKFDATIRYDANDLAASKFDVTIDLASVATGDADRDGALPGSEFFDVAKHPKARFVTSGFRTAGDAVTADGELTIKGIGKPVSLSVQFSDSGDNATLSVSTTLKRLDFNVGDGEYADTSTIGADVKVNALLKLAKQ